MTHTPLRPQFSLRWFLLISAIVPLLAWALYQLGAVGGLPLFLVVVVPVFVLAVTIQAVLVARWRSPQFPRGKFARRLHRWQLRQPRR
jgi:hypothetical protein